LENSIEAAVSRMCACDGLPFSIFETSADIRKGLEARGFGCVPKSANTFMKMVIRHAEAVRNIVRLELRQLKKDGKRFSLTIDEWTSTRNRRYMNVNIHSSQSKFLSFGMASISGKYACGKMSNIAAR